MPRDSATPILYQPAAMRAVRRSSEGLRHVFLTLAAFALLVKILVPTGWMVGPRTDALPFPIVICTGDGAMILAAGEVPPGHDGQDAPGESSAKQSPCAFAGQGATLAPPLMVAALEVVFPYAAPPAATPAPHRYGPGITGPPLPARGPPTLLI